VTSVLDEGKSLASHPGRFTSKKRAPGTHWIGGWVGPRAGQMNNEVSKNEE